MPDLMDNLVEAELMAAAAASKPEGLDDEDKALLEEDAMTRQAARELTDSIKASVTATYILVKRAHDLKAWKSLGYKTWEEYVKSEFDMSAARSYQLINQADVIKQIEEVTPDGTKVMLTEAQARDIKKELPRITEKVKAATSGSTPDDASKKVKDIVDDERKSKKSKDKDDLDDWGDEDPNAGDKRRPDDPPIEGDGFSSGSGSAGTSAPKPDRLDPKDSGSTADDVDLDELGSGTEGIDEDMMNLEYAFQFVESLNPPEDVAKNLPDDDRDLIKEKAEKVADWFNKLLELLKD